MLPKHPAQSLRVFAIGLFKVFYNVLAGFNTPFRFAENLALTSGFLATSDAGGRRLYFINFSPLFLWGKCVELAVSGNSDDPRLRDIFY